jgi:hypothetical protein
MEPCAMPKPDLETQLTNVDDWVHQEFNSIDELLVAAGCERRDESGPGRAYRMSGRVVLHSHPKYHWLGLGFPEQLRSEVDVLTTRVRPQQGAAWINYSPDLCDRETVDLLVEEALRLAQADSVQGPKGSPTAQGPERGGAAEPRDEFDLALILDVIRAFKRHEQARGVPASAKILREAIYFHWEGPRLPRGRKRSPLLRHSPAAREQRSRGDLRGLVYEHVLPISHVIRGLLADVPENEQALRRVLQAAPEAVIITKAEDAAIDAAGMREVVPPDGDPWGRYRAAGLNPEEFSPTAG